MQSIVVRIGPFRISKPAGVVLCNYTITISSVIELTGTPLLSNYSKRTIEIRPQKSQVIVRRLNSACASRNLRLPEDSSKRFSSSVPPPEHPASGWRFHNGG